MKLLISQDEAQAIHDYLMGRPMREVENLVNVLRALERVDEPQEPAKPAAK